MLTIESQDCFHLDISFVLLSLRLSSLSWRPGFPLSGQVQLSPVNTRIHFLDRNGPLINGTSVNKAF